MVANRTSDFKYLSLNAMTGEYGTNYQLRLSSKLGRKTIGLGSDKIQALNLCVMVDEEINRLVVNKEPIELDSLKALVRASLQVTKERKESGLRLVEKDSLSVLWDKYVAFHVSLKTWEETYVLTHIKTVGSLIKQCPVTRLEQKNELVQWLFESNRRSAKTSKDRFKLIVTAIDWNSKTGNIPRKWGIEYRDLLESINLKATKKASQTTSEDDDIKIFSVKEVYAILDAFKNETCSRFPGKHKQYYNYVYFLWLTGCRPSEAIGLKWDNVDLQRKRIKFCEGEVYTTGKIIKKSGTKTVEARYFPINEELETMLTALPHRTGYVFRNATGRAISQQAFRRVWKGLLDAMGIEYHIPYHLRHTMISYHANNDFPIHKLAELVGNSEKIIKEHYLKLDIERISLPGVIR